MEQQFPIPKNKRHKSLFINGISWLEYMFIIHVCFYFTVIRRVSPRPRTAHYVLYHRGAQIPGEFFMAALNVFSIITAIVFLTYNNVPVHVHRTQSAR